MPERAFDVLANPPLVPFWLATWLSVFPGTEISLHLAMIPFSLFALHAFDLLAWRIGVDRVRSALLLICSPAFLLAGQVVMLDVAMFSFLLVAVFSVLSHQQRLSTSWESTITDESQLPGGSVSGRSNCSRSHLGRIWFGCRRAKWQGRQRWRFLFSEVPGPDREAGPN